MRGKAKVDGFYRVTFPRMVWERWNMIHKLTLPRMMLLS